MAEVLMLHVGAPKTGTTYLQQVIWGNRASLESQGVFSPFRRPRKILSAAADVRGTAWGSDLDLATGAELAEAINKVQGTCLISQELFCASPPDRIGKFLAAIDPATDVHVIYATRDPGRQVPAMWQHAVRARGAESLEAFLERIQTDPEASYWQDQSSVKALDRWGRFVDRGRFHLLTVPAQSADPAVLWSRFAGIVGIDPASVDLPSGRENVSLGLVETELLRRLNERLGPRFPMRRRYIVSVHRTVILPALATSPDRDPIAIPPDRAPWFAARAGADVAELTERREEYDLVGDLAELVIPVVAAAADAPDLTDDGMLLDAALKAWIRQLEGFEALAAVEREHLRDEEVDGYRPAPANAPTGLVAGLRRRIRGQGR
ncbi:MAG TPA: hypothetical protein VHZ06_00215 [Marmoricola sp.]|jgi:hypothetical protein|nr:hypothetical protein [Marmoricola sp.]